MKLIVGLGNKGSEYEGTRHNIGFIFLDYLSDKFKFKFDKKNKFSVYAQKTIRGEKVVFIKPTTYMNLSGKAVTLFSIQHKIAPENILIVHDDMDLEFLQVKIKKGGGAAGHNGIIDITERLNTEGFTRLRLGVGRPEKRGGSVDHVLGVFEQSELDEYVKVFENLEGFIINYINVGYDRSAGRFKI